jgi:hypothetical protein
MLQSEAFFLAEKPIFRLFSVFRQLTVPLTYRVSSVFTTFQIEGGTLQ